MEMTEQSTLIKRFRKLPNELVEHIIKFLHYDEYKALSWRFHQIARKTRIENIFGIYERRKYHYDKLARIRAGVRTEDDMTLTYIIRRFGMSGEEKLVMETVFKH